MADGDGLGALQMRVSRHQPRGVRRGLDRKRVDQGAQQSDSLLRHVAAVQPEVERDLIVA